MARTKQIKKPCEICGREIVSSAMHMHLKKCKRENAAKPNELVKPAEHETSSKELATKTDRTEVILVTEPKAGTQKDSSNEESGISRFFGSLADFVKAHPEEIMPIVATAAAVIFPQGVPGQTQEMQAAAVVDKRTWAEKGKW